MLPEQTVFLGFVSYCAFKYGFFCATYLAVSVTFGRGPSACCLIVITRKLLVPILVAVNCRRHSIQIIGDVLDLRLRDQLLSLQHPAQQQADNDQNDGDFDEGEAFLMAFHGMLRK